MKSLIAGNWKMNKTVAEARQLANDIATFAEDIQITGHAGDKVELLLCPAFVHLGLIYRDDCFGLGAQDCSPYDSGAHTGDISPAMLADLNCSYVILGHSERRQNHGETSEMVAEKASAAHKAGLKTIICVGETLEERENGSYKDVISEQIDWSVPSSGNGQNVVIAYEPVWAIGTGKVAGLSEISEIHDFIQKRMNSLAQSESLRIIYGGSVKPDNAKDILSLSSVHGALIGGASLQAESFIDIAKAAL